MHGFLTRKLEKIPKTAFSAIESLVVIVVVLALFFVLAPPLAYKMGWLTPPLRDMEMQIRDVRHPVASGIPSINKLKKREVPIPRSEPPLEGPKP